VLEERADGSLVVAPERPSAAPDASPPPIGAAGGALMKLFLANRRPATRNVPELLAGWGIPLRANEEISEFVTAELDDRMGFLAVTTERIIFVPHGSRRAGAAEVEEHLLYAARNVELVRSGLGHKLRVSWHGRERLIGGLTREALTRIRDLLTPGPLA
jgi:hypothetical protein